MEQEQQCAAIPSKPYHSIRTRVWTIYRAILHAGIVGLILVAGLSVFLSGCYSMVDCIEKHKIEGVILDKQKLPMSHGARKIVISNNADSTFTEFLVHLNNEFYHFVQVGDSIYKDSNSLKFTIKRQGRIVEYELFDWE